MVRDAPPRVHVERRVEQRGDAAEHHAGGVRELLGGMIGGTMGGTVSSWASHYHTTTPPHSHLRTT